MEYKYKLHVTDPKYCKPVNVPGRPTYTNVDLYWLLDEVSKEFGAFGDAWGFKETRWSENTIGDTTLAILDAVFFFPGGEFPIRNADNLAYKTKQGYVKIDNEVYKKVETNTLSKALSRIGFGTDVYMGKFEDQQYVAESFQAYALIDLKQRQEITKRAAYYQVNLLKVAEHFGASTVSDIPADKYNEALAFIDTLAQQKKGKK